MVDLKIHNSGDKTTQQSRILDLEIRYRKFTMTKVKSDCPLFLQRKLTNEQKIENIRLLMESQDLGLTLFLLGGAFKAPPVGFFRITFDWIKILT